MPGDFPGIFGNICVTLYGTSRSSIDASSRRSRWRITFAWTGDECTDVEFVSLEDTH